MEMPQWMRGTPPPSTPSEPPRKTRTAPTPEGKALMFVQFEMVLPRILEAVCAGATVNNAIRDLKEVIPGLEPGPFLAWLKKRPAEYAMYKDACEIRAEVWTGKYLEHATGLDADGNPTPNDVTRDKLAMDAYKWLISTQNRRDYGDVKQVQIDQQISIVGALDAARSRVQQTIAARAEEVVDVDALTDYERRQMPAPVDDPDEDE